MLYINLRRKLMNEDIMELVIYSYPNPVTDVKIRLQYPEMEIDKEMYLPSISESYPFECDIAHVKNAEGEVLLDIEYLDTNDVSPITQTYKLDIKKAISPLHFKNNDTFITSELRKTYSQETLHSFSQETLHSLRIYLEDNVNLKSDDYISITLAEFIDRKGKLEIFPEERHVYGTVSNILQRGTDESNWYYLFHNIPTGKYIVSIMVNETEYSEEVYISHQTEVLLVSKDRTRESLKDILPRCKTVDQIIEERRKQK